jgi:hypothetical protein
MNNTICLAANNTVGCTFLEWSIHFLSGQSEYYKIKEREWIPLVSNPLSNNTVKNAHNHNKNHPSGYNETKNLIDCIPSNNRLYSFYSYPASFNKICQQQLVDVGKLTDQKIFNSIRKHRQSDFEDMIQYCLQQEIPVVYVYTDPKVIGYFWDRRSIHRMAFSDDFATQADDYNVENQKIFFQKTAEQWEKLNLTNVWDLRERMALDIRPYNADDCWMLGFDHPFTWINCQELWHSTEDVLITLMNQFNLSIDNSRLNKWLPILYNWQKIHQKNLKFYNIVDYIVTCIVMGWNFPLESLTLQQEAIIQHQLIYQHNLNLKTWNLSQFPDNTSKLHLLLEKNTHIIDKIY